MSAARPHTMTARSLILGLYVFTAAFTATHASSVAGQETLVGVVGRDFVMLGADSSMSQSIALTSSNLDKIAVLVDPLVPNIKETVRQQTILAAAAGDAADADRLVGLLKAYAAISEYEAGVGCDVEFVDLGNEVPVSAAQAGLTISQVAHMARGQIASALRSRQPYKVCLLVAGMAESRKEDEWTAEQRYEARQFLSSRLQQQVEKALQQQSIQAADRGTAPVPTKSALEPRLYWLDEYGSVQKLKYGAHGYGSNFCLSILDRRYKPNLSREEAEELIRDCFEQLRTRYVINSPQPPCIKCVDSNGFELLT